MPRHLTPSFVLAVGGLALVAAIAHARPGSVHASARGDETAHGAERLAQEAERALPPGWRRARQVAVGEEQVRAIGARLGVRLVAVDNDVYEVGGVALQVNRLVAADEAEAMRVAVALAANGRERFVARRGCEVAEFARMGALAASAARHALGWPAEEPVLWRATFEIACVERGDDMEGNRVFGLCLEAAQGDEAERAAAEARIAELVADWTFGRTLRLAAPLAGEQRTYTFEPAPLAERREGDVLVFEFPELPRRHGLPFVRVTATVGTAPWYEPRRVSTEDTAGAGVRPELLAATPAWPSDHERVRALVDGLVAPQHGAAADRARPDGSAAERAAADGAAAEGAASPSARARCQLVFDHVVRSVRYGGDVVGSRYGALQVLEQGYGRCWDASDVLVTLLRAAGLEARQVAGWLAEPSSGHVWVEVRIPGEGWLALDPTCPWLGTSRDHVPWLRSEDGHMPIVYLALPQLVPVR